MLNAKKAGLKEAVFEVVVSCLFDYLFGGEGGLKVLNVFFGIRT